MLTGLLVNQWTFFALFTIVHFGCWIEYQKIIGLIDEEYTTISRFHKYGIMALGWFFMIWMTNNNYRIGAATLYGMGWYCMIVLAMFLLATEIVFKKQLNVKLIGYSVLGLLYISVSWGLMIALRNKSADNFDLSHPSFNYGALLPCGLIFAIWINDTMQYVVGSLIGKTPFSKISPKKTWEGTIGGSILCVVTIVIIGSAINIAKIYSVIDWIVIASIAAIIGTTGDLLESKLKRLANIKDSGQIMPGHGGFLDRFDSLVLAVPFVWLYVHLFIK
jgi:phosphatidate cytidylyltransferase